MQTTIQHPPLPVLTIAEFESVGYVTRPDEEALIEYLFCPEIENKTAILDGPPGVGKTEFAKAMHKCLLKHNPDSYFVESLMHSQTTDEQLFEKPNIGNISANQVDEWQKAIVKGALWRAALRSQAGPTVLLLDEFDKSRPAAESLMLGFLQDGRVQGSDPNDAGGEVYAYLPNLIVLLTSNGRRDFDEATIRRAMRYEMTYHEAQVEVKLLRRLTGAPVNAITRVVSTANMIRTQRGSSVSLQEMKNLLHVAPRLKNAQLISVVIRGTLMKRKSDLSPKEVADLSVDLLTQFALPKQQKGSK